MIENKGQPYASVSPLANPLTARRPGGRWALSLGALVAGLVLGGAMGASFVLASNDPTQSDEYRALQSDLTAADERIESANAAVQEAEGDAREAADTAMETIESAEETLMVKATELDQREQALVAREQAVTAIEQQIAARSVGEGTWTVGVDIEPGTYRTAEAVGSSCYWGIYRSGSNGSDIIGNGIPGGGFPVVNLQAGQDFVNNRCGTFVKQ